ncbi:hypothetical protein AAE478_002792 [Parahypoxylon ruwenzoriense]
MCSTVQFTYSCGCTESTVFQCPDTIARGCRRRRRRGEGHEVMTTALSEECHDCALKKCKNKDKGKGKTAALDPELESEPEPEPDPELTPPTDVLQERELNMPTKRPPSQMMAMRVPAPESQPSS